MKRLHLCAYGVAALITVLLAGCGGGGSGAGGTPAGVVNVQVTDGPGDEFQHIWVTVAAIAFHTDANAPWSASDAVWQKTTLASPVTIDMTALNNGALNSSLFAGLSLPPGTYHQIRFFLDGAEAPLDASATAMRDSTGTPLQWNDQVEYVDANNAFQEAPLEIAYPTQGIALAGNFTVAAGATLSLAVDFDLEHDVVPFRHDGVTYFTLRPNLHYYDMSQVAAISGTVDRTQLCPSTAAALSQATPCAFNLIAKAELLSADGSRHAVARQTAVDPLTGAFTLYPVATKDASGNPIAVYDVLVRGRKMETLLVQGVAVSTGTSPTGTGAAAPSLVQSTPIRLTLNSDEYAAQLATPLAPLTSGYAIFQQTLPGAGTNKPYEVRWRNTDPFLGVFRNPIALQGASSTLHVATYNGGSALAFATATPAEGPGAYTVANNEAAYYTLSAGGLMLPPAAGTSQTFVPQPAALASGVGSGTINVTLNFSQISVDNNCELVLARFASIIDSFNCSALLSNSVPAAFSLSGVPAGGVGAAVPGAYYYAYVRLWATGNGKATRRIVPLPGFIDLRSTPTATLNGTVPGA